MQPICEEFGKSEGNIHTLPSIQPLFIEAGCLRMNTYLQGQCGERKFEREGRELACALCAGWMSWLGGVCQFLAARPSPLCFWS